MDSLTISATANGVNYLPEYLAGTAGLFADRDLDVVATPKDPGPGCSTTSTPAQPTSPWAGCGCRRCTPARPGS